MLMLSIPKIREGRRGVIKVWNEFGMSNITISAFAQRKEWNIIKKKKKAKTTPQNKANPIKQTKTGDQMS